MGNIYNFEKFKIFELKTGTIMFSELNDNWSAEYNLDKDLDDVKKNFKKLGRDKTIKKVINIISKIDKKTWDKLIKLSNTKYHVNLPEYNSAKSNNYWRMRFPGISKLIICVSSLSKGIEDEKGNIKNKIKKLQNKLASLDNIDKTNEEWGGGKNTIYHEHKTRAKDKYIFIGYNGDDASNDELELFDTIYQKGIDVDKNDIEYYISLDTIKEMLPIYNDVNFKTDWSVNLYKYDNYFMIQNSEWWYLFKKL